MAKKQVPDTENSWVPSNGSEGCWFTEKYCEHCVHEKFTHTQRDGDKQCEILNRSFLTWPNALEEWVRDENGNPKCTEHKRWDWGNDDDDGGLNEPTTDYPVSPNQLCMPFLFDELEIKHHEQEEVSTN